MDTWADEEDVIGFDALMDLNQPYTCTQWGNFGINGIPVITNDGNGFGNHMFNWFNTGNAIPSNVWIDHTMTVRHVIDNTEFSKVNKKNPICKLQKNFKKKYIILPYNVTFCK